MPNNIVRFIFDLSVDFLKRQPVKEARSDPES